MKLALSLSFFCSFALFAQTPPTQQQIKDAGVSFGNNLINSVKSKAQSGDPALVPGYQGSYFPQSSYYNNQSLGSLQSDAGISVTSGTASDAASFAYQKSQQPKLQFGINDPIIQNSLSVGNNTLANPAVVTTQAGNCSTTNVATANKTIEHCTAWMNPTNQKCQKRLTVSVTYKDNSCTPGSVINLQTLSAPFSFTIPNYQLITSWGNITIGKICSTDPNNMQFVIKNPTFGVTSLKSVTLNPAGSLTPNGNNFTDNYPYGYIATELPMDYQADVGCYFCIPSWARTQHDPIVCANNQCTIRFYTFTNLGLTPIKDYFQDYTWQQVVSTVKTPIITDAWTNDCAYLESQVQ